MQMMGLKFCKKCEVYEKYFQFMLKNELDAFALTYKNLLSSFRYEFANEKIYCNLHLQLLKERIEDIFKDVNNMVIY